GGFFRQRPVQIGRNLVYAKDLSTTPIPFEELPCPHLRNIQPDKPAQVEVAFEAFQRPLRQIAPGAARQTGPLIPDAHPGPAMDTAPSQDFHTSLSVGKDNVVDEYPANAEIIQHRPGVQLAPHLTQDIAGTNAACAIGPIDGAPAAKAAEIVMAEIRRPFRCQQFAG